MLRALRQVVNFRSLVRQSSTRLRALPSVVYATETFDKSLPITSEVTQDIIERKPLSTILTKLGNGVKAGGQYSDVVGAFFLTMMTRNRYSAFDLRSVYNTSVNWLKGPSQYLDGHLIKGLAREQNGEVALQHYRHMRKSYPARSLTLITFNQILRVMCENKRMTDALAIVDDMRADGVSLDEFAYTNLIQAYAGLKDFSRVQHTLQEMRDSNVKPNEHTYAIIINGLCDANEIHAAEGILEEMKRLYVSSRDTPISKRRALAESDALLVAINAITNAYVRNGQVDAAFGYFDVLKGLNIYPDRIFYSNIINGYSSTGQFTKAESMLHEMIERNISPNVLTFTGLIKGYTREKNMTRAMELLHMMKSMGVYGNTFTYNTLIQGFASLKDRKNAVRMYEEMGHHRISPNFYTYSALMMAYVNSQDIVSAKRLLYEIPISNSNIRPNDYLYNIIMTGVCREIKTSDITPALSLIREMRENNVKPDIVTYNTILARMAALGLTSTCRQLLTMMTEEGIVMDDTTFHAILRAHIVQLGAPATFQSYDSLRALIKESNPAFIEGKQSTQMLFKELFHTGSVEELEKFFELLKERKVVDAFHYNLLLERYSQAGVTHLADALLKEMDDLKIRKDEYLVKRVQRLTEEDDD